MPRGGLRPSRECSPLAVAHGRSRAATNRPVQGRHRSTRTHMSVNDDRIVIITGGSSGIGRAAARSFAEQGARVVITGRHAATLEEAAGTHPNIVGVVADAAVPDDAARTVAKAVDTWGRLD